MTALHLAFRTLTRTPGSTIFIIGLLGIGLGASATIFSLFDAVVLRPLPVVHPEQLVRMVQRLPKLPARSSFAYQYYGALRDHASTLQYAFGETGEDGHLRMTEPAPAEQITVHAVTPEFFKALGVKPYWGRGLMDDDAAQKSGMPAAILSYNFWRRHFSGEANALTGKTLVVNGHRLAIVGVMPRDFNGIAADTSPDVRVPLPAYTLLTNSKIEAAIFELAGRLKPGVTKSSAEAECLAIWNSTMRDYYLNTDKTPPGLATAYVKRGMNLETLVRGTSVLRDRVGDVLALLMVGVTVLVLIIGLNVAGLLLARAAARQREMAVRLAIGASPLCLARQMMVESFLLATFSAMAAICFALIMTPIAVRMLPPIRSLYTAIVPVSLEAGMNWRGLLFLMLITVITTLIFTISPVLAILRLNIDSVLRTVRASTSLRGRQVLISLQIALCTFLLVCASQLGRSFQQLESTPSGFARDYVATFTCELEGYKGSPAFLQALKDRVLQLPGVLSVATSSIGVMREHGMFANVAPAGQRVGRTEFMGTNANNVSPEYFKTMGMRIVSGRDFTASDMPKPKQAAKAVVSEAFVRRFYGSGDPLGKRFGSAAEGRVAGSDFEIVGVVSDAKYRSLKDPIRPMFYTPESDFDSFVLNVRTQTRPEAIIGAVQQAAASVAPDLPFLEVNTLAREMEETTAPERTTAVLASLFGVVAAVIAGVGTYGLLSYAVRQRRREIGIRMAIGARQSDVVKLIARQTFGMTVGGVVVGLGAAVVGGRAMRSLLYGVSPSDLGSFAIAGVFVVIVAMVATIAPVLNATGIRPAEALRLDG